MSSAAASPPAAGTRVRKRRRWLIVVPIVLLALGGLTLLGLFVIYPRVGARVVRDKVISRLHQKLGRDVTVGDVTVKLGHATIRDIDIRGPDDGDLPLVHVEKVEVEFEAGPSLLGRVHLGPATVDGVSVNLRRHPDGRDNVRDVLERLRSNNSESGGGGGSTLPTRIDLTHGKIVVDDMMTGATMVVADGTATWTPGELRAVMSDVIATTIAAPKASVQKLVVEKLSGRSPTLTISGGELALYPRLALSSIAGTVHADPKQRGHYRIDLSGGYGGVPDLWTAKGPLDTTNMTASISLEAEKFQLDRLAPILAHSAVVDYQSTSIDTKLKLDFDRHGGKFEGEFHLSGLNVGHPMIAEKEVRDLDLSGQIAGTYDRAKRTLELSRGDFVTRNVPFSVTGSVARPRRVPPPPNTETAETVRHGPGGIELLDLRLVIPPIDCQRMLDAIPKEMVPYMVGYKMRGVFDVDVKLGIDWAALDDTILDGHVGLRHCRVVDSPEDSPKRLLKEFEHYVEVEKSKWISFVVGESNEDFVKLEDISPYMIKSIMTTEDGAFYRHHGFIPSEFRTALVHDLQAGAFRYGASSITMQMVKNVLLYREKTLARKLQELFLTWNVENTLSKDRILEIYFNVIEFGPGLYGIGPAAKHYFGKAAKDLNPVEAAFFSSILPNPKQRYKQYCTGEINRWTQKKIERILKLELKREKLTQEEYDQAIATPLVFDRDDDETERECLKRTNDIIKNARSTNPMHQDTVPRGKGSHHKQRHPKSPKKRDTR